MLPERRRLSGLGTLIAHQCIQLFFTLCKKQAPPDQWTATQPLTPTVLRCMYIHTTVAIACSWSPAQIRPERCEKIFLPLSPLAHGQIPDKPVQPISGERMTTFYSRDTVIDAFPQRLLSAFWAAATNPQTPLLNWQKRGTLRRAARPFDPFSCCRCEIYSECGKEATEYVQLHRSV